MFSLFLTGMFSGCRVDVNTEVAGDESLRHLPAQSALGPYSAAVLSKDYCFVSGQIGSPESRHESFAEEADSAIDAVEAELIRAGLSLEDVLSVTVYLTDLSSYSELNTVYALRFPKPYPARTCVAVTEMPGQARIEIQVIARNAQQDFR